MNELLTGAVTGILFGFFMQKAQVIRYDRQLAALRLKDMTIVKFMLTTILVAMVGIYLLLDLGLVKLAVKPLILGGNVLGGLISPLKGVGPDQLRIRELLKRLEDHAIQEVILATNPTVDGEATASWLARILEPIGVRTTRIGLGLPIGSDLEYADELTLNRAMEGRRPV